METIAAESAYAKLTRTLKITGVRDDGYHLIESEMVSIGLVDTLEFSEGTGLEFVNAIEWTPKMPTVVPELGVNTDATNLVARALALTGTERHVKVTKRIPVGAGLGGGSADAAAVLRHLGYTNLDGAFILGSDVPFCLRGGRAIVTGAGEEILSLDDVDCGFVILTPPFSIMSGAVYVAYDSLGAVGDPDGVNDLWPAARAVEPRLAYWSDLVRSVAGEAPALAGSGSSLFLECTSTECDNLAAALRERIERDREKAVVTATQTVPAFELSR